MPRRQRIRVISDKDAHPNRMLQLDEGVDFEAGHRLIYV